MAYAEGFATGATWQTARVWGTFIKRVGAQGCFLWSDRDEATISFDDVRWENQESDSDSDGDGDWESASATKARGSRATKARGSGATKQQKTQPEDNEDDTHDSDSDSDSGSRRRRARPATVVVGLDVHTAPFPVWIAARRETWKQQRAQAERTQRMQSVLNAVRKCKPNGNAVATRFVENEDSIDTVVEWVRSLPDGSFETLKAEIESIVAVPATERAQKKKMMMPADYEEGRTQQLQSVLDAVRKCKPNGRDVATRFVENKDSIDTVVEWVRSLPDGSFETLKAEIESIVAVPEKDVGTKHGRPTDKALNNLGFGAKKKKKAMAFGDEEYVDEAAAPHVAPASGQRTSKRERTVRAPREMAWGGGGSPPLGPVVPRRHSTKQSGKASYQEYVDEASGAGGATAALAAAGAAGAYEYSSSDVPTSAVPATKKRRVSSKPRTNQAARGRASGATPLSALPALGSLDGQEDGAGGGVPEAKACRCSKSACLKLYCECFAQGALCDALKCRCHGCLNREEHRDSDRRRKAVEYALSRNKHAFAPSSVKQKRCHCARSRCVKKYCECFQQGVRCAEDCRCSSCENYEGSPTLEAALARRNKKRARRGSGASGRRGKASS